VALQTQCYTVDLPRIFHRTAVVDANPEINNIVLIVIGIKIIISYGRLKISSSDSPLVKEPPADAVRSISPLAAIPENV